MLIAIILFFVLLGSINRYLVNLERKQEALYYNIYLLRQKIREEEQAYLY